MWNNAAVLFVKDLRECFVKAAMTKHCSSCGAFSSNEARFCRLCGAPFGAMPAGDSSGNNRRGDVPVSPLAETVPLSDMGRTTENIAPDDLHGGRAPETSKVSRAEMEDLLRRPPSEEKVKRETEPHAAARDARQDRVPRPSANVDLPTSAAAAAPSPQISKPVQKIAAQSGTGRRWPVTAVSLVLVALVVVGLLVWLYASRRDQPDTVNNASANSTGDERQAINAQLAEASALLASNDTDGAIMRLREIIKLDPSNQPAHLKLAEALDRSGAHEEAINEYLAATKLNEQDSLAWSALAHAQFIANRFDDAAESYRRLSMLADNSGDSDEAQLEHAAALENAGHTEEARALYLKIAAAAADDATRRTAQQRLAGLPSPSAFPSPPVAMDANNSSAPNSLRRNARANLARQNIARQESATNALPAPSSPNAQSSARLPFVVPPPGAASSGGKRAASNDPDSYYIKGLSVLNQRDPKTLKRAEVVTALGYFQRAAQPGGTHRAAAQQLAERLGREYDKRRGVK